MFVRLKLLHVVLAHKFDRHYNLSNIINLNKITFSYLVFAFSNTYGNLLIWRAVQGAGSSFTNIGGELEI